MIKRRFYRHEHGDRNSGSDSSSSSSDSELEAEAAEETEAEDDIAEVKEYRQSHSSSSGYKSEDSTSANEVVDVDSSGLLTNDDNIFIKSHSSSKRDAEIVGRLSNTVAEKDSVLSEVDCILKCKSVFRCRLCPRIVCLSEETLKTHLKSKRHARSEKLLSEGRLKLMLNSDGEIEEEEEDGETHAERHARIVAATQNSANSKKKNKGRQRQRKRLKKKEKGKDKNLDKAKQLTKSPAKKRLKSEI